MSSRSFLRCIFPLLLSCILLPNFLTRACLANERPHILFVMVDDLGKDWIQCYGGDHIQTPNIDQLATTGMKFNNCYSMPQCTPTRATLLTGQYPWRTGWTNHWDVPRWGVGYFDWERYTTFATIMKSAGYKTAIAGKWQINDFRLEPDVLAKHGFDDWCVWTGYEATNPPSAKRYWDPYVHTREGSKTHHGKFGPDIYCDFLCDFIQKNHATPMMLYFPMVLTHGPLVTTPDKPNVTGKMATHRAMVEYTDKLVGRLVTALNQAGIRDNTMIVFTTDNGSGGGVRGTIDGKQPTGGKASNYEGGCCEPFIVNCPGKVPAGVETDALTDFSDLLPTFAELGSATIPSHLHIDGTSIAKVMLGKANDSDREWILAMGHGPATLDDHGVRARDDYSDRVIRDKRYKIWVESDRAISALYDLTVDPWERNNLINSPAAPHRDALNRLQGYRRTMPAKDARPAYRPRKVNAWDKHLSRQ